MECIYTNPFEGPPTIEPPALPKDNYSRPCVSAKRMGPLGESDLKMGRLYLRLTGSGHPPCAQCATGNGKEEQKNRVEGEAAGPNACVSLRGEHPGLELGELVLLQRGIGGRQTRHRLLGSLLESIQDKGLIQPIDLAGLVEDDPLDE